MDANKYRSFVEKMSLRTGGISCTARENEGFGNLFEIILSLKACFLNQTTHQLPSRREIISSYRENRESIKSS